MEYNLEILPRDEKIEEKRQKQIVKNPKGCLVLVHGICHGAWCWDNFITFFAGQGYQCYAVSLRGHAGSEGREQLSQFRLSDYVDDVKAAIKTAQEDMEKHPHLEGVKPFLLGHSMGGAVVQQYIGKYAHTVQGAVLFAPATAPHMSLKDVLRFFPLNLSFASLISLFGWNCEFLVHNAAFFIGENETGKRCQRVDDTSPYQKLLQQESKKITGHFAFQIPPFQQGDLTRPYSEHYKVQIPVFVIGSYADLYFPEASLKKTADAYAQNGLTALVRLKYLCHDMMLDRDWRNAAQPVLEFVENPLEFVQKHRHNPSAC